MKVRFTVMFATVLNGLDDDRAIAVRDGRSRAVRDRDAISFSADMLSRGASGSTRSRKQVTRQTHAIIITRITRGFAGRGALKSGRQG
jgi:hypothetical protein